MKFSAQREAPPNSCFYPQKLRQHRAIRQEVSDRIFPHFFSLESEGILYVFLVFQTEEVGQKDGGDSQTQLCGVALRFLRRFFGGGMDFRKSIVPDQ